MSWRVQPSGFGLVEVMVALLMMAIALLGIVRILAAAVEVIGVAEDRRRAQEAVSAVSQTALPGVVYPIGRHAVSLPGPDALPGTADDPMPLSVNCRRQIDVLDSVTSEWLWVRAWCGVAVGSDEAESPPSARLLVAR